MSPVPLTSFLLTRYHVDAASALSARHTGKPSISAGIRIAMVQVDADIGAALAWVIRRYGDPLPPRGFAPPIMWQTAMYNSAHSGNDGAVRSVAASGLAAPMRAVAKAFGYGSAARGVAYALDYLSMKDSMPVPDYIQGASRAEPAFKELTLEQHVERYQAHKDLFTEKSRLGMGMTVDYKARLRRLSQMGGHVELMADKERAKDRATGALPELAAGYTKSEIDTSWLDD